VPTPTGTTTRTSSSTVRSSTTSAPLPGGSGTATYSGNPFTGVDLWANEYYASEVMNLAVPSLTGAMATAAAKVAEVPSFMWM
jgi:cellulose 1,4-beta-cellobiosidase